MKLNNFISVFDGDTLVQIIKGDTTIYYGTVSNANSAIDDETMRSLEVTYVRNGFRGLFIFTASPSKG